MCVLCTGATGFVGSAIVRELIGAGHQVLTLGCGREVSHRRWRRGASRGMLKIWTSLRSGVAASDSVIHTAFIHDLARFKVYLADFLQLDATHLYRLALDQRPKKGLGEAVINAVAEEGVQVREIAEVIGRGVKVAGRVDFP
jgi:uncharacterized protein YbjT (DUF2867 family)